MTERARSSVLFSGASGLIGSACAQAFSAAAWRVERLVRHPPRHPTHWSWDPAAGRLDSAAFEGVEAVIHLSGEPIPARRWNAGDKRLIRASRVDSTRLLAETIARLDRKPRVLVTASAIGCYGNRGDEILTEESPLGRGFLAGLVHEWEAAAAPAAAAGVRVVSARFGLVLSRCGSVLPRILPIFEMGLGGRLGDGQAWWSWIAIDDLARAVRVAVERDALRGPVNVTAPEPVRNAEFTRTLARVLRRPAVFHAPAFALRLALGEMVDETILASARVIPAKLLSGGFVFRHPSLEAALRHVLDDRPGSRRGAGAPDSPGAGP